MASATLIATPHSIADSIEDSTKRVVNMFLGYTRTQTSFEQMVQDYLMTPNPLFSAFTHKRAYSYDNNLIRLQTVISVLMDIADSVAEGDIGLDDRTGLVLRWEIDRCVLFARRHVNLLLEADPRFKLDRNAAIFGVWPHAGRELVRSHPLFDLDNEEFH